MRGQVCSPPPKGHQKGFILGWSSFSWWRHSWIKKKSKDNYLLQLPQKLQLQPPIGPTLHQQLNRQLQLQLQLQRRTTVHWPTGVHQEGVYTRWNGYCLMRGLVGQDKRLFHACAREGAHTCARACAPALARACSRLRARVCAYGRGRLQGHDIAGAK